MRISGPGPRPPGLNGLVTVLKGREMKRKGRAAREIARGQKSPSTTREAHGCGCTLVLLQAEPLGQAQYPGWRGLLSGPKRLQGAASCCAPVAPEGPFLVPGDVLRAADPSVTVTRRSPGGVGSLGAGVLAPACLGRDRSADFYLSWPKRLYLLTCASLTHHFLCVL